MLDCEARCISGNLYLHCGQRVQCTCCTPAILRAKGLYYNKVTIELFAIFIVLRNYRSTGRLYNSVKLLIKYFTTTGRRDHKVIPEVT